MSDWTRAADALKSTLTALTTDRVGASDVAGSEGAAGVAAGLVSRPLEVHALVNCAGFPVREPFGSINEASIDMQCNVMLKAAINLSQVVQEQKPLQSSYDRVLSWQSAHSELCSLCRWWCRLCGAAVGALLTSAAWRRRRVRPDSPCTAASRRPSITSRTAWQSSSRLWG